MVRKLSMSRGQFLPKGDPSRALAVCVLGEKVKQALFGQKNPIGQWVRINDRRFRVIGVMESKGQILGFDLDDAIYIPAAKSMSMFNRDSLMEIDLTYRAGSDVDDIAQKIKALLIARDGDEDFNITTQEQMVEH